MNLEKIYKDLFDDISLINSREEIEKYIDYCIKNNNQEYLYKYQLIDAKFLTEKEQYAQALLLLERLIKSVDKEKYKDVYLHIIDQLIYICVTRKFSQLALKYIHLKSQSMDTSDIYILNRWRLELAYVYSLNNEPDKAIELLESFLNSYGDENMDRINAFCNLAKLYIDVKHYSLAEKMIQEAFSLHRKIENKLNVEEKTDNILYIDYLSAKLFALEKNYKKALMAFETIFDTYLEIPDEYKDITNEYIKILLEVENYKKAKRIIDENKSRMNTISDLHFKKNFYILCLKTDYYLTKSISKETYNYFNLIAEIDEKLAKDQNILLTQIDDDIQLIEYKSKVDKDYQNLELVINSLNKSLTDNILEDSLLTFSLTLDKIINLNSIAIIVFNDSEFLNFYNIKSNNSLALIYSYLNGELKAVYKPNDLFDKTVVKQVLDLKKELYLDLELEISEYINILNGTTYHNDKSLYAFPLTHFNKIFAVAIYTLNSSDVENKVILRISSLLLENKLLNYYLQRSLNLNHDILNFAISNTSLSLFYYDIKNNELVLTKKTQALLETNKLYLNRSSYDDNILTSNIFQIIQLAIRKKENYNVTYKLKINDSILTINEIGCPFFDDNNSFDLYVCTIQKLSEEISTNMKREEEFNSKIVQYQSKRNIDYNLSFIRFHLVDRMNMLLEEKLYFTIHNEFNLTYMLNDGDIISIIELADTNQVNNRVKSLLSIVEKGIISNNIISYPKVSLSKVRYPFDVRNLNEIKEVSKLIMINKYNEFTPQLYIEAKNYNLLNELVDKNIKADSFQIVKKQLDDILYYENVLINNEIVNFDKLTNLNHYNLEMKLLESAKYEKGKVLLHLHYKTLDYLINTRYFNPQSNNIIIIIVCLESLDIVQRLKECNCESYIYVSELFNFSINDIISKKIDKVFIDKTLSKHEEIILKELNIKHREVKNVY